jgi:hypothetical protein
MIRYVLASLPRHRLLMFTQALSVVDCPEFRTFLLYCARELKDEDIPHRTKTTKAMVNLFYELMGKWGEELCVCYLFILILQSLTPDIGITRTCFLHH